MEKKNKELGKMIEKIPGVTTSGFTGNTKNDILDLINQFKNAFQNNMEICTDFKNCLSEHKRICTKSFPCCKINNVHANDTEIMFLGFDDPDKIKVEWIHIQNDSIIKKIIEEHLKVPK